MKNSLVLVLFVLAAFGITAAIYAAPPRKAKAPVLTPVTVAMTGMTCPSCAAKLQTELAKTSGVTEVKVTFKPQQVTATLDETKITASAFTALAGAKLAKIEGGAAVGAALTAYIDAEQCKAEKKMCDDCFVEVPKVLKGVKGVKDATLDEKTGKVVTITFAKDAKVTTTAIAKALAGSKMKFTTEFTAPKADEKGAKDTKPAAGGCCGM